MTTPRATILIRGVLSVVGGVHLGQNIWVSANILVDQHYGAGFMAPGSLVIESATGRLLRNVGSTNLPIWVDTAIAGTLTAEVQSVLPANTTTAIDSGVEVLPSAQWHISFDGPNNFFKRFFASVVTVAQVLYWSIAARVGGRLDTITLDVTKCTTTNNYCFLLTNNNSFNVTFYAKLI